MAASPSDREERALPPALPPAPHRPSDVPDPGAETGASGRPTPWPRPEGGPWWRPAAWPLALLVLAAVAAFLAGQAVLPGWLGALALVLACAGAAATGALWAQQRQAARLHALRTQHQLMAQLQHSWQWQTDASHRLVRFQPPQAAPASAWVGRADVGTPLWTRLDDAQHSLRDRLQAQAPVPDLRVDEHAATAGGPLRQWRLRALPCLDPQGQFAGHLGLATPTDAEDRAQALAQLLQRLLDDGPGSVCRVVRDRRPTPAGDDDDNGRGNGWRLLRASPAAAQLLGLNSAAPGDADSAPSRGGSLPWSHALARLPEALRPALAVPRAGPAAVADGWSARWLPLDRPAPDAQDTADPADLPPRDAPTAAPDGLGAGRGEALADDWLLLLAPADSTSDDAVRALAAEHAAFSYTISHDLRAPIRVVEGFGRILKEDYGQQLDRIGNDHLDRVVAAAARMNQMIDALLALSQLSTQPLARQRVNLSQLAGYVVDELRRASPERQVAVHIAPNLHTVGDPTLLRMALENLLGNAWKYSARTPQAELRFDQVTHAGQLVYRVADNGAGFDMRFVDRLFGVFQRLHSASDFQGTGVGLASVRRIVRRHGGEIWAESEVGQGARFYFTLKG